MRDSAMSTMKTTFVKGIAFLMFLLLPTRVYGSGSGLPMPQDMLGDTFEWLGVWIAAGGGLLFVISLIGFGFAQFTDNSNGKSTAVAGMIGSGIVIAAGLSTQIFLSLGQ